MRSLCRPQRAGLNEAKKLVVFNNRDFDEALLPVLGAELLEWLLPLPETENNSIRLEVRVILTSISLLKRNKSFDLFLPH